MNRWADYVSTHLQVTTNSRCGCLRVLELSDESEELVPSDASYLIRHGQQHPEEGKVLNSFMVINDT
jgi:hypothetical protein